MLRRGSTDVASAAAVDAGVSELVDAEQYEAMHVILKALRERRCGPALAWYDQQWLHSPLCMKF